jgi:pyruvate kinase
VGCCRQCSIIGTIGPKTKSVEMLTKLREAGLNIVRMK